MYSLANIQHQTIDAILNSQIKKPLKRNVIWVLQLNTEDRLNEFYRQLSEKKMILTSFFRLNITEIPINFK